MTNGVDQVGIAGLKYIEILKCHSNTKIYDVNHFANTLIELYCGYGYDCGVDQNG